MTYAPHAALAFALVLFAAGLVWAAASDFFRYLIPNRACILIVGAYLLALPALPLSAWLGGLGVGIAALALGTILFARGWVGGGDVKLAAALSLWAGPALLSGFAFVTSLAGAALAVAMLSPLRRLMPRPAGETLAEGLRQPMPFGVPLAAGGGWVLTQHLASLF